MSLNLRLVSFYDASASQGGPCRKSRWIVQKGGYAYHVEQNRFAASVAARQVTQMPILIVPLVNHVSDSAASNV